MSIGDQEAFPCPGWGGGMTYRMWLIGKILSGMNANPACNADYLRFPELAAGQADIMIARLDAEKEKRNQSSSNVF
jgi:hypothetical protein